MKSVMSVSRLISFYTWMFNFSSTICWLSLLNCFCYFVKSWLDIYRRFLMGLHWIYWSNANPSTWYIYFSPSCVWLFATPWTVAYQAPPSMGFSGQEYWSGLLFPSPGDRPNPGIKLESPALQADSLPTELLGKPHLFI